MVNAVDVWPKPLVVDGTPPPPNGDEVLLLEPTFAAVPPRKVPRIVSTVARSVVVVAI